MKKLLATLLITFLPSVATADVIGVDFSINDSGTFNFTNSGGAQVLTGGGIDPDPAGSTYAFTFSGLTLDLSIDLPDGEVDNGVAVFWNFTNIDLGGEIITAISQTLGFPTVTPPPAIGGVPIFTSDSISLTTSAADLTTDGGVLNYQFAITTNSAAAVPEPSSVAMLCALGLGGVWVRRRRQASAA